MRLFGKKKDGEESGARTGAEGIVQPERVGDEAAAGEGTAGDGTAGDAMAREGSTRASERASESRTEPPTEAPTEAGPRSGTPGTIEGPGPIGTQAPGPAETERAGRRADEPPGGHSGDGGESVRATPPSEGQNLASAPSPDLTSAHPEILAGAGLAAGFALAQIVKRLGRE